MPTPTTSSRARAVGEATQTLLRRFRSQKPIRGGSLLVTIFGDAIAPRGGGVTLGSLIQLARPFGLTDRLVRTSVARLAQDGWLVARRQGRLSEYRLTPSGQQRFAEATTRIYGKSPASWDGQWTLLVLPPAPRKGRESLRDELRWLGFGQISPGTFAHPGSSLEQARQWLQSAGGARDAMVLRSCSEDLVVDRRLVAAGWDLGDLARRYRRFVDSFTPVASALIDGKETHARDAQAKHAQAKDLHVRGAQAKDIQANDHHTKDAVLCAEAAFVIRTLLIHDYRKIHLQDPLLPPALLPDDWVGSSAYDLCSALYARVFNTAEEFLSVTASTVTDPLPAAEPSTYNRFGGLTRMQSRHAPRTSAESDSPAHRPSPDDR
jgi:phenylacetic acid degradation operon negative regulatory protein